MISANPAHRGGSCQCGGRCGEGHTASVELILNKTWPGSSIVRSQAHNCGCSRGVCPRRYHAAAGLVLGAMLIAHLATSALGVWPAQFQSAVNRIHRLGSALPWLEMTLIGLPMTVHVGMGLNSLRKSGLRPGVEKHHHGSDLRYWLQRMSAVVLLVFIAFHVLTLHRWAAGRFDPNNAFASTTQALRQFWSGQAVGAPANLLLAQFYLLGIAAAVYHLANGVSTSVDVFDLTPTPAMRQRVWHACIIIGIGLGCLGLIAWYAFLVR
jgi:succinate dehydrogenase / fumarate reductase cytochrome b subunit